LRNQSSIAAMLNQLAFADVVISARPLRQESAFRAWLTGSPNGVALAAF
jgi:hypothetical protein